jgi:hypothetical protein
MACGEKVRSAAASNATVDAAGGGVGGASRERQPVSPATPRRPRSRQKLLLV